LRHQAGVKQYDVAEALAIDPSLISRYERGSRPAPDRVIRYYAARFGAADLLEGFVEIARESDRARMKLRDPELIAKQAEYPLAGDQATFVSETPPDGVTVPLGATFQKAWTIRNSGTVPWYGRRLRRIGPTTSPWTLTSPRFIAIPDTEPGQTVTVVCQSAGTPYGGGGCGAMEWWMRTTCSTSQPSTRWVWVFTF
jgi:transcriptional regulator with XRE-family HTH domain